MGWNDVELTSHSALIEAGEAYFLHSYHFVPTDPHHIGIVGEGYRIAPRNPQRIGDRMKIARAVIDECNDLSHQVGPWLKEWPHPCADRVRPPAASPGQSP